jgi:hypothetical protein
MPLLCFEIYLHGLSRRRARDLPLLSFGKVAAMRVRQIIRSGGFEPQDVKRLDAVFDASWHQLAGYYPAEGTVRDAARERLASIVVTLGKTCRFLDAVELQTRAVAMFGQRV